MFVGAYLSGSCFFVWRLRLVQKVKGELLRSPRGYLEIARPSEPINHLALEFFDSPLSLHLANRPSWNAWSPAPQCRRRAPPRHRTRRRRGIRRRWDLRRQRPGRWRRRPQRGARCTGSSSGTAPTR